MSYETVEVQLVWDGQVVIKYKNIYGSEVIQMTIFVTGDIHGSIDIHKLNSLNLRRKNKIKQDDYLIICGDFGLVFEQEESKEERYWLNWLDAKPWTTLFVDGNHENFDRLKTYPIQNKWDGKVQQISEKVFHLMRGEVYQIEDQKIFAFGGAFSHDREYRIENETWWQEELPSLEECENAIQNLRRHNNEVDIIVTHDAHRSFTQSLGYYGDAMNINGYNDDRINILDFFEEIFKMVTFKDWFCGHYHIDYDVDSFHFLYQRILDTKEKENAGCIYPEFQLGDKVIFAMRNGKKPNIRGIIYYCYPYGLEKYRYGYSDYDILCTEEKPLGKNVICKRVHEEWIRKDDEENE